MSSQIPPYSPKTERDIYDRWLKKYQAENTLQRSQNEQNIFKKIQDDRDILNRLGPIPQKEKLQTSNSEYGRHVLSQSLDLPFARNKQDLYTLDGYPRGNYLGFYSNGYGVSRSRTDITNAEMYDKVHNLTYDEYKEKQKEFLNFNQLTANDNIRQKDYLFNEKKRINEERLKEGQRLREMEYQEKQLENEKKRIYKNLLDDQLKVKVPSKLGEEYYVRNFIDKAVKFNNPNLYLTTPENSFMNRNKLVEINPYSLKKTEIGNTMLNHNPIINPVFDYKYNRYLFPREKESAFKEVGKEIANK